MTEKEKEKLSREVCKLRGEALSFIHKHFSLTKEECEDVCQESLKAFYLSISKSGFLLTSTLSSFFLGICKNKALEEIRKKNKMFVDEKAMEKINEDRFDIDRIDMILALDCEPSIEEQRYNVVERIVNDLPHPCNILLWGQYWDCLSMSMLATIGEYKSEAVVRVKLSECRKKFKLRFQKESASLYY